ncbi:MAG: flagellar basal body L-ring protein FlgH [Pseudomonadota bacterium]
MKLTRLKTILSAAVSRSGIGLALGGGLLLGGCAVAPQPAPMVPPALPVMPMSAVTTSDGAIYSATPRLVLFEDVRARSVGDVLTVVLSEQTNASKSASTATDKETGFELSPGPLFGTDVSGSTLDSSQDFAGNGSSSQNNSLTGSLTVTVVGVLDNGLLAIQGEKWLTLNQGKEYLRIAGHVRGADIRTDNSVLSTQIANAQITYSGAGALHDANRQGWLTRMFASVLSPL